MIANLSGCGAWDKMSAVNYASLAVISGYDILVTYDESVLCVLKPVCPALWSFGFWNWGCVPDKYVRWQQAVITAQQGEEKDGSGALPGLCRMEWCDASLKLTC